ncbi:hypothetical protein SAMN02745126_05126 [Enhydrobacter aerosaccus]|uniref:Uncharacterized protein n=2 Tax=Enhydrobacter aerosaccus TaxID=225324 RepID=A0A1T4SUL6_9HYPH|nr:hypothetical protein SAMN02745126_05126 [Enhydrobacter aerosaccus]
MGMYFNTAATTEMNAKVNNAFNADSIDYWKKPGMRALFGPLAQGGATLSSIAGQNGIYPGAGYGSTVGKKWFKWLDDLDTTTAVRACFHKHLDRSNKCVEMYFTVVPKASMPISITESKISNPDGTYSAVITIATPTAAVVRAAIKKRMSARKKGKS